MTLRKPSTHGGRRPGAGRPRTTGTGRALRLSPSLLARVAKLGAGETPQARIAGMCDQLEHVRRVVAGLTEPAVAMDALRAMLRAVDGGNGRPAHYVFDRAIIDRCIVDEQPSGSFEIAPGVYVTPHPGNVRAAEDGAGIDTPNAPTGGRSGG